MDHITEFLKKAQYQSLILDAPGREVAAWVWFCIIEAEFCVYSIHICIQTRRVSLLE